MLYVSTKKKLQTNATFFKYFYLDLIDREIQIVSI